LAQRCANIIKNIFPNIDVIIPVPPSNLNRPFQPVNELASRISELTKIPVDFDFIKKLPTEQIKTLSDQEARNIVLERAISIKGSRYKGRNILLFDDLFRSGDTLNAIAKKLRNDGEVNNIKALCVTKTRVKK
nr:ComF family protein [Gammaproteobacteria bacterium]